MSPGPFLLPGRPPNDPGWPWASIKPAVEDVSRNSDEAVRWFAETYGGDFKVKPYDREDLGLMGTFDFPYELLDEAARTRLVVFAEALWRSTRSRARWGGDPSDIGVLTVALRDCVIVGEMTSAALSLFPDTDALAAMLAAADPDNERVREIRRQYAPEEADERVSFHWLHQARMRCSDALGTMDLIDRTMRLGPDDAIREIWNAVPAGRARLNAWLVNYVPGYRPPATARTGCLGAVAAVLLATLVHLATSRR